MSTPHQYVLRPPQVEAVPWDGTAAGARSIAGRVPVRLEDDYGLDAIEVYHTHRLVMRGTTRSRYKRSGLSGSEWRTCLEWEVRDWRPDAGRQMIEFGTTTGHLVHAVSTLYPLIATTSATLGALPVSRVCVLRKGHVLATVGCPSRPRRDLLALAGHLPDLIARTAETLWLGDVEARCFQPGCAEPPVVTYERLHAFYPDGLPQPQDAEEITVRRFCETHRTRGDCRIDDCDKNYRVLDEA